MNRLKLMALIVLFSACGGGGSSAPTPTPPPSGPQASTFTGSASTNGTGGCSSTGHSISTGTGTLSVTLVQSSAARVAVQVCHPSAVNHALECTVPPFALVTTGSAVSATLKGGQAQVITVYPEGCGLPGTPAAVTVTYTIRADYPG